MLIGDKRKSVSALIVPNFDAIKEYAAEEELDTKDIAELIETKEIRQLIRKEIERLSTALTDFERVKMFTLLDREFTEEADEMTPTLKLKRKVILERYGNKIEKMYGGESN